MCLVAGSKNRVGVGGCKEEEEAQIVVWGADRPASSGKYSVCAD